MKKAEIIAGFWRCVKSADADLQSVTPPARKETVSTIKKATASPVRRKAATPASKEPADSAQEETFASTQKDPVCPTSNEAPAEEAEGESRVDDDRPEVEGILDLAEGGFGFLRFSNFLTSDRDIYVSPLKYDASIKARQIKDQPTAQPRRKIRRTFICDHRQRGRTGRCPKKAGL